MCFEIKDKSLIFLAFRVHICSILFVHMEAGLDICMNVCMHSCMCLYICMPSMFQSVDCTEEKVEVLVIVKYIHVKLKGNTYIYTHS